MNSHFGRNTPYHIRVLVDHVPAMLAHWDRALRCRFANRAHERWSGVDSDELTGTTIRGLLGPHLFALDEPHIRTTLNGKEQLFERASPAGSTSRAHGRTIAARLGQRQC